MKYAKHLRKMKFLNSPSVHKKKKKKNPLSSLLWGFALTFNWSYLPVQICGSDTCHVLERIEEEAEETRGSDLGL